MTVPAGEVPQWGCIADDFTGACDLAGNLVRAGHRTALTVGLPTPAALSEAGGPDAVVVALKTRTAPPAQAVDAALAAYRRLAELGCSRFWFKYCSTFDSTPAGNIGPVTDALLDATGAPWTIACPAFPDNGRTVYQGHLFVGDRLLSESGMRHHPLTPMTDPDLVRVLGAQTRHPVGLLPHTVLRSGDAAVRDRLHVLTAAGAGIVVTDVLGNDDFPPLLRATAGLPLLTGGSGLALALPPPAHRRGGPPADRIEVADGPGAVLAGSVSDATLGQTAQARRTLPHRKLAAADLLADPDRTVADALAWARSHLGPRPVLLHSADDRDEVRHAQRRFGAAEVAAAVERGLAACARGLLDAGVGRLVVAGGETSGAVLTALGVDGLRIGPAIAPGVPWTAATYRGRTGPRTVNLALKSGNFGAEDLFTTAENAL
ncbi:four-carbon acid sugar kinase family protein [Streptomyces sp. DSM 42041]|uniref:3-oxo-tetronate kinase n=1 Tax=Streptomyces hazeniae TaxID=3075538 RepID=A0ABU2NMM0_9ACTN|nr:3-oxo-tetronate kinase [Streptomyces sp. DSM 42041]MDT0378221.1 four-carbon acid sugar kinase family protein [Streptomyces sp. DSM 42041]